MSHLERELLLGFGPWADPKGGELAKPFEHFDVFGEVDVDWRFDDVREIFGDLAAGVGLSELDVVNALGERPPARVLSERVVELIPPGQKVGDGAVQLGSD